MARNAIYAKPRSLTTPNHERSKHKRGLVKEAYYWENKPGSTVLLRGDVVEAG